MIELNVGGIIFFTSKETLNKYNSFFTSVVNYSDQNNIFIDRDPTHFRYILNYMRGSSYLPNEISILQQLKEEADFYCLDSLVNDINNELEKFKFYKNVPTSITIQSILQKMS